MESLSRPSIYGVHPSCYFDYIDNKPTHMRAWTREDLDSVTLRMCPPLYTRMHSIVG